MGFRVVYRILLFSLALCGLGIRADAGAPGWSVPILVYHRFEPDAPGLTAIPPSLFAEQLEWLKTHDIAVLPLQTLVAALKRGTPPGQPAVVLTADDGHRSVYNEMYPLLQKYNVHATLFIYPSAISNSEEALTWEQLEEMVKSGLVDVQSHTYWHPNFNVEKRRLDPAAYKEFVNSQLTRSKERLEAHLGTTVDLLAWPFGLHDSELEEAAKMHGYVAAFSIERKPIRAGENPFALPRFQVTSADHGSRFEALIDGATGRKEPQ